MTQARGPYFEGWYFKHQWDGETQALIPGFFVEKTGERGAFLQVISGRGSWFLPCPLDQFGCRPDLPAVRVGESLFTPEGVRLHVEGDGLSLHGEIRYGFLTPPRSDIMGPFRLAPGLECRHTVISLGHSLRGRITLNGESFCLDGGTGYIEGDRGRSFPKRYTWTQCNTFENRTAGVMLSVAEIPYMGLRFTGCIASVWYKGRDIRLATYTGARAAVWEPGRVALVRGETRLEAELLEAAAHPLKAPAVGRMARTIHEHVRCTVRYRFYQGGHLCFDRTSPSASFEEDGLESAPSVR